MTRAVSVMPYIAHAQSSEDLRKGLIDIGDGLAGAFVTLYNDPDAPSCEALAIRLHGAARHVMRLRETLQHSDKVDGR